MNIRRTIRGFWDRHAGGLLPIARFERSFSMTDGTSYDLRITWLRRAVRSGYDRPGYPRRVRRERAAVRASDRARADQVARRVMAGEPLTQVGDIIPHHAGGIDHAVLQVRTADLELWKRAEGDERYYRSAQTGELDHTDEYEWIRWTSGEWGGAWATTAGMLHHGPLTVIRVADHAAH